MEYRDMFSETLTHDLSKVYNFPLILDICLRRCSFILFDATSPAINIRIGVLWMILPSLIFHWWQKQKA